MARKPRAKSAEHKAQLKEAAWKEAFAEGYRAEVAALARAALTTDRETFRRSYLESLTTDREAFHQRYLESMRAQWERSGNPLFAWAAIAQCQHLGDDLISAQRTAEEISTLRAELEERGVTWAEVEHQLLRLSGDTRASCIGEQATQTSASQSAPGTREAASPAPFPEWVLRYLGSVALEMYRLIKGRNWRASAGGPLDPDEAARLIARTLGITRPGFNAFRDFETRESATLLAREERRLREAMGLTAEEAAETLAQRLGYHDPRSVQRIVSKARRRVAKPTGKVPP